MISPESEQFPQTEKAMEVEDALRQVKAIEDARRDRNYEAMKSGATGLLRALKADKSEGSWVIRSKVSYEQHMAAYQQWKDDPSHPMQFLDDSLEVALRSAEQATWGNDPVGRLLAQMNISGLIFPAFGKWQDGLVLSQSVSAALEVHGQNTPDEGARDRALRGAMNCYVHQVRMYIANTDNKEEVRKLIEACEANPVFQKFKAEGAAWIAEDMGAARGFLER